jgi:hypothetical protein
MSKRILVMEDEKDNRQIIRDMLGGIDCEITEAEDAEQALAERHFTSRRKSARQRNMSNFKDSVDHSNRCRVATLNVSCGRQANANWS